MTPILLKIQKTKTNIFVRQICRIFFSLQGTSSSGPDNIPTRVLNFILQAIVKPLTELFKPLLIDILPSITQKCQINISV